jgi:serine/threonine protein kinase
MAMDFLIGETLAKHIEEKPEGRLLFREVLGILIPPMEALIELHKNGLFHVDINPNHVCVSGSSGKLLDFGGAKRATRFSELTMQVWGLNGFFGIGAVRKPSSYTFSRSNGWNAFRSVLAPRQLELHAAPKDCLPPSSPLTEFVEVVFSRMASARSSPKTTIFRIVLGQGY